MNESFQRTIGLAVAVLSRGPCTKIGWSGPDQDKQNFENLGPYRLSYEPWSQLWAHLGTKTSLVFIKFNNIQNSYTFGIFD